MLDHVAKRAWVLPLIGIYLFAQILGVTRGIVHQSAVDFAQKVEARHAQVTASLTTQQESLARAKAKHCASYLEHISYDALQRRLDEAKVIIDRAKKANESDFISGYAAQADRMFPEIEKGIVAHDGYLQELDEALLRYKEMPRELSAAIVSSTEHIDALERAGYYARHFVRSRELVVESQSHQKTVGMLLQNTSFDVGKQLPDYLAVYRTGNKGLRIARQVAALADSVPGLRLANERTASSLRTSLVELDSLYLRARASAERLDEYPRYRCLQAVVSAMSALATVSSDVSAALQANSMDRQEFDASATILNRANNRVVSTRATFTNAIETWRRMEGAIQAIPASRSSATSAIRQAQEEIDDYDWNSQDDAESTLERAQAQLNSGDRQRKTDPIRALEAYESAYSLAVTAKDEVDTSSKSSDSSIGGGYSSPSSGYGGGGYSSPSSGSGGSYGGGGYSSPSGGSAGGPSGGSAGSGGF